jgi:hypothetical protein
MMARAVTSLRGAGLSGTAPDWTVIVLKVAALDPENCCHAVARHTDAKSTSVQGALSLLLVSPLYEKRDVPSEKSEGRMPKQLQGDMKGGMVENGDVRSRRLQYDDGTSYVGA